MHTYISITSAISSFLTMGQLHIFFFPMMAQGHMIPTIDIAKLFAAHGVRATIITTHLNAPLVSKAIARTQKLGMEIGIKLLKFPAAEVGLPPDCETLDKVPSADLLPKFFQATAMLRGPLEDAIRELRPNCLVSDMFFTWTPDVAAEFGIPRLVFHGTSFFALCCLSHLNLYKPHREVSSDSYPFVIPNLPHEVKLTKLQLPEHDRLGVETEISKMLVKVNESELKSYGMIANSFYELEPAYADHYRNVLGRKAWHIGPVSLCNREIEDKAERGRDAAIDKLECLKWLDSKKPNSVIYICFGSMANFSNTQLYEIAMGLEASEQDFIWVVRKPEKIEEGDDGNWFPEGFEERIKGKGLIIKGWAPQVMILDHEAVGGFVTHCGWNSTLEGVSAGVPMVTWPVFAEQFYNEKLVTEILRTGVAVGAKEWQRKAEGVGSEAVEKAVKKVMVGEEAEGMRNRAMEFKDMARKAVEEGGSSYSDLNALIEELSSYGS